VWAAAAEALWAEGLPLRIYVTERGIDLMAHHAIFDGIRGIRLLNELLGNLGCKGAIKPHMLPSCVLACSAHAFARVLAFERPRGTLSARPVADACYHASHYIRVPTELIKRVKETHGVGFAPALQGLILYALFRCGMPPELHVASTVGFKSDWLARLGSAFNHYGAFPISARDDTSPQAVAKQVAKKQRRTGMVAGFPCLLANASLGGATSSMSDLYKAIDVLIGGGPLIMDPSCDYDCYRIYKFSHTVPIYILYVTICDAVDISIHTRVPLPGIDAAFTEALAYMGKPTDTLEHTLPHVPPTPSTTA